MDIQPVFPRAIDSTMLACSGCEMKFFIEYCLRRGPTTKSPDLHAGGAFASAIETTRRAYWFHKKSKEESLFDGVRTLMDYWGGYEPPDKYNRPHVKTFVNTVGALDSYFLEYPLDKDPFEIDINDKGEPSLEFTFAVPLPIAHPVTGDPVLYAGRCDAIGSYAGIPCAADEKTTASIGRRWGGQWNMRGQFLGYVWAAQQYGYNLNSMLVRGIAIQVSQYQHIFELVTYPQFIIDRWADKMVNKIQSLVDCFQKMKFEYSFGDACASYGGCWATSICEREKPEDWYSSYPERIWDPLEKDPLHSNEAPGANLSETRLDTF